MAGMPVELHIARIVLLAQAAAALFFGGFFLWPLSALAVLFVVCAVGLSDGRTWGRGPTFVVEAVVLLTAVVESDYLPVKIPIAVTAALALPGTFPGFPSRRPR